MRTTTDFTHGIWDSCCNCIDLLWSDQLARILLGRSCSCSSKGFFYVMIFLEVLNLESGAVGVAVTCAAVFFFFLAFFFCAGTTTTVLLVCLWVTTSYRIRIKLRMIRHWHSRRRFGSGPQRHQRRSLRATTWWWATGLLVARMWQMEESLDLARRSTSSTAASNADNPILQLPTASIITRISAPNWMSVLAPTSIASRPHPIKP